MVHLTTLSQIHRLEERYPFNEEELEILIRCHDHIISESTQAEREDGDFLEKLAFSSPYTYFFLPGDEMRQRVTWLEDHILPEGFPNKLRAAISEDAFVTYANEGQDRNLERFLEGIADTGRRGPKEALRVMYEIIGDDQIDTAAHALMDLVFRLSVASDAFVVPNLDHSMVLTRLNNVNAKINPLVRSLKDYCLHRKWNILSRKVFIQWAESNVPLLSAPLSTFIHRLVFRDSPYPVARVPYRHPELDHESAIFTAFDCPSLFSLSLTSRTFHGKMHCLYSSDSDGMSFSCLEYSLLGYDGPNLLVIKTQTKEVIGAFAHGSWRDSIHYNSSSDYFIFQLQPRFRLLPAVCEDGRFMYLRSGDRTPLLQSMPKELPHGIGIGGSITSKPLLFIPDTLEHCAVGFMDLTHQVGCVLPDEHLQRFEIECLEVWGVGDDAVIQYALKKREEYRVYQADFLKNERTDD
ncbi:TLD domain containing protein [Nitzschia inconspicua]|uniref:Oxidation resistance protein 1 n=1 Tax=Nitzschia inconspicua TaxID=303405 RepID=A0A9K3M5C0_9STRA|nr:TLD domain containing protein [Nitzschia inconspicua]